MDIGYHCYYHSQSSSSFYIATEYSTACMAIIQSNKTQPSNNTQSTFQELLSTAATVAPKVGYSATHT